MVPCPGKFLRGSRDIAQEGPPDSLKFWAIGHFLGHFGYWRGASFAQKWALCALRGLPWLHLLEWKTSLRV